MINLLPPSVKEDITFGRKNRVLLGWIGALGIVIFIVLSLTLFGNFYIKSSANSVWSNVDEAKGRIKDQNLEKIQQSAEIFGTNLETVVKLLKDQLLFSKLIKTIGSVLPDQVILREINFESKDSTMQLYLQGPSEQAVTQAFINISSDQSKLFSKADLVGVDCSEFCTAEVVVLLNKDSEFYFLNDVTSKGGN